MSADEMNAAFYLDRIDQSELEQLLLSHFGGSMGVSPEEIQYARQGSAQAELTLRYSRDGEIAGVEAGPTLTSEDIAEIASKIERFLLTSTAPHVGQVVLFASLPTLGWFRYEDVFQLIPVPADAPRPNFAMADHPLLLQYRISGSEDAQISTLRRTRVGRELELLCAALTTNIRGAIGNTARHHWSIVKADDPSLFKSEYCQEGYTWPGANGIVQQGYTALEGIEPIPRTGAATYYPRIGVSAGTPLDLPDVFESLLDRYFASPRVDKDRFLRAAYWFQYAQRVANISRSGAYMSLVSSVEALMREAQPSPNCAACNRPTGIGPTKRFIDFVETYAPGSGSAKDRRQLYSLRSALAHGGTVLIADRHAWGSMSSTWLSEMNDQRAMWQLVRVVLVNWLAR
jgi:hypothetical protein